MFINSKLFSSIKNHAFNYYKLPSSSFLRRSNPVDTYIDEQEIIFAKKILDFYKSLNIDVSIEWVDVGHQAIRFSLRPGKHTTVRDIVDKEGELATYIGAYPIRAVAPLPGKSVIAIEIPRITISHLPIGDMISSEKFTHSQSADTVCIGKDLTGGDIVTDFTKLGNLLITGATGMGKSVVIENIITSILFKAKPHEVKLVLADPKQVEFARYKNLPHLYMPIIYQENKAVEAIKALTEEMNSRFKLFEDNNKRNFNAYNDNAIEKLPRIIVIFDEIADFVIEDSYEFEDSILALLEKAHYAGIHLVLATQRVNSMVVTERISANIRSRICLKVSRASDSTVGLLFDGGEKLLGHGDMLFTQANSFSPIRIQAPFISGEESKALIEYVEAESEGFNFPDYNCSEISEADIIKIREDQTANTESSKKSATEVSLEEIIGVSNLVIGKVKIGAEELADEARISHNRAEAYLEKMMEYGLVGDVGIDDLRYVHLTYAGWKNRLLELVKTQVNESTANKSHDNATIDEYMKDNLFIYAVSKVVSENAVSTALIQRKLSIGFAKAARYIDAMEAFGFVSSWDKKSPRRVMIDKEIWKAILNKYGKQSFVETIL